jgi:hypothetical protein
MPRRRGRTDALEISREPRWLVVRDRASRALEYRALSAGSDLRTAMAAKQSELAAAGVARRFHSEELRFLFRRSPQRSRVRRHRVL